jgi:Peptidase propeptide and YPEB domain
MPTRHQLAILTLAALLAGPAAAQQAPPDRPQQDRADPAWLTADQVRTVLRARGYTEIGGLTREGDSYKVTDATRYGEKVPEIRIDALTGQPREMPPLTERQARSLLMERGYTSVEEMGRDGELIRLRARQGDTPVELRVNARTGALVR